MKHVADPMLERINRFPDEPAVRRVINLLEHLRKAEQLRLELYEQNLQGLKQRIRKGEASSVAAEMKEYLGLLEQIDTLLNRYKWSPRLRYSRYEQIYVGYAWPKQGTNEDLENAAVGQLLDHVDGTESAPSRILRFRSCKQCGQWFYALADHAQCCSTPCRKKFNSKNPEFKAKRANYMRLRRRREQIEEKRSWRFVGKER